ncbi:MAG: hypothetical protein JWM47_1843 [Acidimicrobiales bacterium]|nr:hypothetical protein [Acidimicrobiales bacterium]
MGQRRLTARRATAALAALSVLPVVLVLGVAILHPRPGTVAADPRPRGAIPPATPALPVRAEPAEPAPSGPVWLPLRRNVDGGLIKVGCTFQSHGSPFGYECGGHHDRWALDLMADAGTPVYAAGAGFATNASGARGGSGYGNNVRIDHGNGLQTIYAHLSAVLVPAEGAWVDEDSEIGLVGSTGSSSADHLHYEVRRTMPDGSVTSVDPGPLKACVMGMAVSYPQDRGQSSWKGLPWGAFTVFSDGTDCATRPTGVQGAAVTEPGGGDGPIASTEARGHLGTFWSIARARLGRRLSPLG